MHPIPSLLLIAALLVIALLPGKAQPAAYPPRAVARPAQAAEPQAEAIAERPRIRLAVEMAETKEGKTVAVSWLVEAWDSLAEQSDLELVLALPKALTPLEADDLQPGEAPGTWRLALQEAAGRLDFRLSADARLPLEIQASLWRKAELLDVYVALLEGEADLEKATVVDARGGQVSGLAGRVILDFPEGALAEAAGIQISAIEAQQNSGQYTCLYYDTLGRLSGKEYRADASCPAGLGENAPVRYEYDGLAWEDAFDGPGLSASWLVSEPGQVSLAGGVVAIAGNATIPSIRLAHSLDDEQAIHFTFQVDSSSAAGGLQLESGLPGQSSYRRWAVDFSGGQLRYGYNQGATGASDALMALVADRWYEGELRTGSDGVVSLAVWERDNPAVMAGRILDLSASAFGGLDWTFRASATTGVLRLDSVEERVKSGTGQRTAMVDPSGNAAWTYDLRGQMTGEVKTIGMASYATDWEYNAAGLPVSMTYPDGEVVAFDYNPQQLLDGVRSVSEDEDYVSGTRYDEAGRLTWRVLGERLESGYTYHAWDGSPGSSGRLSTLQTWLETDPPGQSLVQGLAYAYHRDGNIQQIQDQPRAETLSFAYDILDRLDAVYLDGALVDDPGYDSQGNLDFHGTSADPRDLVYAAPANHRATGLNGETYAYNANGNLTSRTAGGVTYALSYDAENRLVSYVGGTVAAEFVYDGDGQRVMTVAGSGTTLHVGSHFEVFIPAETPEPTATPTSAPTETPTSAPTPTETATGTPTPAATATVTPTATATGTSFPYNSVLDDFNRANGGVGANWSGDTGWYAIDGQALKATASDKVIYWNGASYGANQEAYFELSTIDPDGVEMGLALKVDAGGGAIYSAIEVFYSQSGQNVQVWTYARGGQGWVQRGSYPVTLANGDQLGAAATAGGQVRVYRNGVLLTTVDVSGWPYYQGGGYIGVWMVSAEDARLDDFGGGTLPTSLAPARPRLAGLDLGGLKAWWERAVGSVRTWWARLWGGGTFASLDVAQGELRLRPATARQLNTPPAGQVWRKYYFAGSARIAVREVEDEGAGDTLSYLLSDHLGSLSEVVTGASVSASLRYAAWGEMRDAQGSAPTGFQFTGQYNDTYINLIWTGSRWFDPVLGRFVQADSIVPGLGEGGNPNAVGYIDQANYSPLVVDYHEAQFLDQLNQENWARLEDPGFKMPSVPTNSLVFDRYAYSLNNPIRYVDPSGHFALPAALALGFGAAGVTISAPVVIIGVLLVVGAVVAYDTFAPGKEERHAEISAGLTSLATQAAEGLAAISQKDLLPKTGAFPYNPPKQKGNPPVVPVRGGGFKDADGNIWTRDKSGHGGPHWDVEHPDGSHTNVNDDGSIR